MPKLEETKNRVEQSIAASPMDSDDSKPPETNGLEGESFSDQSELKGANDVKELAEQQSRNADIMKALDLKK